MKRFMFLCFAILLFTNCETLFHSEGKSKTVSKRLSTTDNPEKEKAPDSVVITGAQFIPIYGKSENGVKPDLEGKWILESMNGLTISGNVVKKLDSIAASKIKIPPGRNDITIKQEGAQITPAQGSSYHIPERPTISFFGSNETFSGFTGCNRYSGRYEVADSNTIILKNAAASTKMVCIGDYDEDVYLSNLHRVNKFKGTDDKLELLEGDNVILTFTKEKE